MTPAARQPAEIEERSSPSRASTSGGPPTPPMTVFRYSLRAVRSALAVECCSRPATPRHASASSTSRSSLNTNVSHVRARPEQASGPVLVLRHAARETPAARRAPNSVGRSAGDRSTLASTGGPQAAAASARQSRYGRSQPWPKVPRTLSRVSLDLPMACHKVGDAVGQSPVADMDFAGLAWTGTTSEGLYKLPAHSYFLAPGGEADDEARTRDPQLGKPGAEAAQCLWLNQIWRRHRPRGPVRGPVSGNAPRTGCHKVRVASWVGSSPRRTGAPPAKTKASSRRDKEVIASPTPSLSSWCGAGDDRR
jgi:hypothetical protein